MRSFAAAIGKPGPEGPMETMVIGWILPLLSFILLEGVLP